MSGPTVRRRRLGAELRSLREGLKYTTETVARNFGWHNAKVSRIETGRTAAKQGDVEALLDFYGVQDEPKRQALLRLARDGGQRGWWQRYTDVLTPVYADFISLEADAKAVQTYECGFVPGLFQTAAYAREIISALNMTEAPEEVNRLVEVRQARQSVLTQPSSPEVWAVVNESALRTRIADRPQIMRDQLQRLLDLSELPNVTLQVMASMAGPHPGLSGAFTVLSFPESQDHDVVLLEHLTNSLYIEERPEVERYSAAFRRIVADALSRDASLRLIRDLKEEGS
ncbi:helix-turn-helix domain-containing protein [Streptomyces chitinivorans]|uniref:Helix-turn-helix domain-containing protein n=1 Tax=Streptomyces chitinivorans TaxID=1257027 RepID=A0ABW7HUP9_9ACTN|nr:helix-turn-helix transcriptional regulator [Streptomyces chitinivorans]MDH2408960.1 helix-turn-helix transcriptional regulator [Streptomyces chitinivorans]